MKTIEVYFLADNSPFMWALKTLYGASCCHVLLSTNIFGESMAIDAHPLGGICPRELQDALRNDEVVAKYALRVNALPALRRAMIDMGKGYNYIELIGYLPVLVGRALHKKVRNPLHSSRAMVCSEFVASVFKDLPGFEEVDPSTLTPDDVRNLCAKSAVFSRVK
jgi:hypothetical protein